jgi:hypothetical protein
MLGIQQEGEMSEDDRPSDPPNLRATPSDDRPSDPPNLRATPSEDRPATGYRYFPASQLAPDRWNLADLRVRRISRRSP